jgi:hypothetical protein
MHMYLLLCTTAVRLTTAILVTSRLRSSSERALTGVAATFGLFEVSIDRAYTIMYPLTCLRALNPSRITLGHAGLATALLTLVVVAAHDEDRSFWIES